MLSTSKYILSKNTCIFDMYYLHIRRKRRRKDCARHVVSYRLQRYFHKEMFVWDCIYRGVVSGGAGGAMAQREKSNIFFSSLTWTPPGTPGVSKDVPLSTKLGFGGLVL